MKLMLSAAIVGTLLAALLCSLGLSISDGPDPQRPCARGQLCVIVDDGAPI